MSDDNHAIASLARLHDLLKLTGDSAIHWCPDRHPDAAILKAKSPSLWKALKHHCVFRQHGPDCKLDIDRETVCICLADHKASAISRRLKHIHASRTVFRVWRDEPRAYGESEKHPEVFKAACDTPDLDVLFNDHRSMFEKRPETMAKGDGSSFTSLLTHADLTATWAEFFERNANYYGIAETATNVWQAIRDADRKSIFDKSALLLRCKIRTHGRLARLRDLQIVKDIADKRANLADALGGALLYELPDEFVVALTPDVESKINKLLEDHLTTSHFVEFACITTVLGNSSRKTGKGFLHNFGDLFAGYPRTAYSDLPEEIVPNHTNEASSRAILCDLCQLAPASVVYPKDAHPNSEQDPISEYLCAACTDVRKNSVTKAPRLAEWEESADGEADNGPKRSRVCLVKVSLDMGLLAKALVQLFEKTFPDKTQGRVLGDEDIGFSILREFLLDYSRFVKAFEKCVLEMANGKYSNDNHDHIMDGFLALRTEKDNEAADIVRAYVKLYDEYFPKLKGDITPIKLSVSCSPIKHPFLEHWDVIDKPTAAIEVHSVRRARLSSSFNQLGALEKIRDAAERSRQVSTFLHRLAEIEARTRSTRLVRFALLEQGRGRDSSPPPVIVEPFMDDVVNITQILAYYKLFIQGREK